jgi:hypothetical protein
LLFYWAADRAVQPDRPVWVFLVHRRFVAKDPHFEGWILLDFLVRIETYQGVALEKRATSFSRRFLPLRP